MDSIMKKSLIKILAFMSLISLVGCSKIDTHLEAQIEKQSGIKEDAYYQAYCSYAENDKLDKDGYYIDDTQDVSDIVEEELPENLVQISVSDNAYLDIEYYSDPSFKNRITDNIFKLSQGETVYAQVSVNHDAPSSAYCFEGFRILKIDQDGDRELLETKPVGDDGLVLSVKSDDLGKELAIEPVGKYEARELTLMDSYIDNNDEEHPLSGNWIVNDKPVLDNRVSINPVSTYIISYEFDSNEYFYLSSEPECFYSNNEDGLVIFRREKLQMILQTIL